MGKKKHAHRGLNPGASKRVISGSALSTAAPTGFNDLFLKLDYV